MTAAQLLPIPTGESAAEWVAIEALRPWKDNPRKNDGEPVRKVAESIQRFGFGAPILARRENGEIIAGHTRWKAAKKLGLDRVPVRYLDLDPADATSWRSPTTGSPPRRRGTTRCSPPSSRS